MTSAPIFLTLLAKKQLTHDVWELEYSSETPLSIIPGQFLLCDCDANNPRLKRSYSVSWAENNSISFIIKRLPEGKGGSIAICDQEIGHIMQVWGPMGHFVLRETPAPKVFIGTGTGFAPLYFQLRKLLTVNTSCPAFFLFGVRELRDVFYQDQLQSWAILPTFDYEIYCSREDSLMPPGQGGVGGVSLFPDKHNHGRVTDYLTSEKLLELNGNGDTEFYICGSPAMVSEVRGILEAFGIVKEKVFFEQY